VIKLIIAGPGTGKTTAIVNDVIDLINEHPDCGIIICTFTRKATEELIQRIDTARNNLGNNKDANLLIGTIHSICFELLARYSDKDFGDYSILSEDAQIHFIYTKLKNLGYSNGNIHLNRSKWKQAEFIADIYNTLTESHADISTIINSLDDEIAFACNSYEIYRALLKRSKLFDFATIQSSCLAELENPDFIQRITNDFQYIFVDEFQDVNSIQNLIFFKLATSALNLTVVGDDDQSIYGFRGSNVNFIRNFRNFYNENGYSVETKILNKNYRSTINIVNFTNNYLKQGSNNRIEKNIIPASNNPGQLPIIKLFEDDIEEANFVAHTIQFLKESHQISSLSEVAILFRSIKNHSHSIIQALDNEHIKYSCYGRGDMLQSAMALEFIATLEFYLSRDTSSYDTLSSSISEIDTAYNRDITSFYSLNNIIDRLYEKFKGKRFGSCLELTYTILSTANYLERYSTEGENIGKLTNIVASFDEFANSFDPWGLYSYISYLQQNEIVDSADIDNSDAVQLMTIHQSKGLEFPVVFLVSQVERKSNPTKIEKFKDMLGVGYITNEDFRLKYVACTRAANYLFITGSKKISGRQKNYEFDALFSKYLVHNKFSTDKLDTTVIHPSLTSTSSKRNVTKNVLSYNSIHLYRLCPLAYKYANVWHLETQLIGGMDFGLNVHKIIEIILKDILNGIPVDKINIEDIIQNHWISSTIRSTSEELKYKTAAKEQTRMFVHNLRELLTPEGIFSSEENFRIHLGNVIIAGRFDAVFNSKDTHIIVDFKTGTHRDYSGQVSLYALCFKEKHNDNKLIKAAIYYLKSGELEYVHLPKVEEEIDAIVKIANSIDNQMFEATPGAYCSDCAYNSICRKKS